MSQKFTEQFEKDLHAAKNESFSNLSDLISDLHFEVHQDRRTTTCLMTLKSGFTILGKSVPVSILDFNAETGMEIAKNNAMGELCAFEAYRLRHEAYQKIASESEA